MVPGHGGCRRRWDKVRGGPEEVAKPVATPPTCVQPQLGWKRFHPAAAQGGTAGGGRHLPQGGL